MKKSVIASVTITKEGKENIVIVFLLSPFLLSSLISILVKLICTLKEEPASSSHDFQRRKGTCKSPRTRAVTIQDQDDYWPFVHSTNMTAACLNRPGTPEAHGVKSKQISKHPNDAG